MNSSRQCNNTNNLTAIGVFQQNTCFYSISSVFNRFSAFGFRTDLLERAPWVPLHWTLLLANTHTPKKLLECVIVLKKNQFLLQSYAFIVVIVHLGKRQRLHEAQFKSLSLNSNHVPFVIYADRTECFGWGIALKTDMNDCWMMSTIYADWTTVIFTSFLASFRSKTIKTSTGKIKCMRKFWSELPRWRQEGRPTVRFPNTEHTHCVFIPGSYGTSPQPFSGYLQ